MFQVREKDFKRKSGQKVCLPELRKQNFLQAENKSKKNKGDLAMNQDKINEIQIIEQTLHNLILQKQNFQMELSETQSALGEIEKSGDDIFKIVGQLMIKTDKDKIKEDLSSREKILELRLKSIEKQEDSFMRKLDGLREDVVDSQNN